MPGRRLAAVLITVLLCHLVVVQPLVACTEHTASGGRGAVAHCDGGAPDAVSSAVPSAAPAARADRSPSSSPLGVHGTPDCCLTLGSCNTSSLGVRVADAFRPSTERWPMSTMVSGLQSRVLAPDPPPPKL
jgi:hypothetical protein